MNVLRMVKWLVFTFGLLMTAALAAALYLPVNPWGLIGVALQLLLVYAALVIAITLLVNVLYRKIKRHWARYKAKRKHERLKRAWGKPGRIDRFLKVLGKPYDPKK